VLRHSAASRYGLCPIRKLQTDYLTALFPDSADRTKAAGRREACIRLPPRRVFSASDEPKLDSGDELMVKQGGLVQDSKPTIRKCVRSARQVHDRAKPFKMSPKRSDADCMGRGDLPKGGALE